MSKYIVFNPRMMKHISRVVLLFRVSSAPQSPGGLPASIIKN